MRIVHRSRRLSWETSLLTLLGLNLLLPAASAGELSGAVVEPERRAVAIFVDNRAGPEFDAQVPVLEDLLASRLASQDFQILSREIIVNALKQYPIRLASPASETPGQRLDQMLSDSTSALRLAQTLGADTILVPAISSYGRENRSYTAGGVQTQNERYSLRLTYRLAEVSRGGEIAGDSITVSKTLRQSEGLKVESSDVVNTLLDDAASQLAERLLARRRTLPVVEPDSRWVHVTFECTITDFSRLPNAGLNEDNEVVLGAGYADAYALDVNVELNGITLGNAPGTFQVAPGLHRLRLTREGFKPFERMINAYEGQTLAVALQMSEDGYGRWKDVVDTLTQLENNRKLTDAEVKRLEGYAEMFRKSRFNIKVDTQEGVKFFRSLYW